MKKSLKLIISIIIVIFSLVLSGCYDKNVRTVREGSVINHPNTKIGDAFDNFFHNGKWKSFKSRENDEVVEFTGNAFLYNKPADFKLQFIVKGNNFELYTTSINGKNNNVFLLFRYDKF